MCVFQTWFHRRLLLIICVFAMQEKSVCAGVFSGSRERNCALWMKSICSRTSWYSLRIPSPVRNNASSPSRQNTSQTRHATSSGNDLLYRVKILRAGQKQVKREKSAWSLQQFISQFYLKTRYSLFIWSLFRGSIHVIQWLALTTLQFRVFLWKKCILLESTHIDQKWQ